MAETKDVVINAKDLPVSFQVKYLGCRPAKGLWGIKHTRKPVDAMVSDAKKLPAGTVVPLVKMKITRNGLSFQSLDDKSNKSGREFTVDVISYGVQDLIYTRVFCMIIVTGNDLMNGIPFECHAFVCDSKNQARQITYALAAAFQDYGQRVKEESKHNPALAKKKFAIDLRTPEEQEQGSEDEETEA